MLVDVGDSPLIPWRPVDADGSPITPTSVTATLRSPIGVVTSLTVTGSTGAYSVRPAITMAGEWLVTWTAVEPGEVEAISIAGVPPGEAAPWAPSLRQVAVHIPSRTRSVDTNRPLGVFSDDTEPSGDDVTRIIESATAFVAGMVGKPIVSAAYGLTSTATALWAAYWTEIAWPERDADISLAARLREDALLLIETAKAVNLGAGGGTVDIPDTDGVPDRLVSFSFPCVGPSLVL
jgi:hypothetical protein